VENETACSFGDSEVEICILEAGTWWQTAWRDCKKIREGFIWDWI